jgi:hypothetical protein
MIMDDLILLKYEEVDSGAFHEIFVCISPKSVLDDFFTTSAFSGQCTSH